MEVKAAYGRKYSTAVAARADWFANKDFRMVGESGYINKTGADAAWDDFGPPSYPVVIRYGVNTTAIMLGDKK